MGIEEEDVRKVVDETDIVTLIGEFTNLKRSGKNWTGLCVFHDERTPSMSVSPEGLYHCFGCGESGDAITFVRKKIGLDFQEAVEMLASRMGYGLRYTSTQDTQSSANKKRLKEALAKACDWYHTQLMTSDSGKSARSYLRLRGYDTEIVKKWKLGWAPPTYNNLSQNLELDLDTLNNTGLAFRGERGDYVDFFRARILFPIMNLSGDPIGFGGRILPDGNGPKYLNSPDSRIYSKSRELYGLHRASKNIVSQNRAVIVEGYTDVIGLDKVNVLESVATCGTSLTEDHLRVLSRFSKNVVLAFDPDSAGSNAMARSYNAMKALEELELEIKVANLKGELDPGDLAEENPDLLLRALDEAVPLLEFRLGEMFGGMALDTNEDKYRASQAGGAMIADFFHGSKKAATSQLKEKYVNYVSDRTDIEADAIVADMNEASNKTTTRNGSGAYIGRNQQGGKTSNGVSSNISSANVNTTEYQILLWAVHKPEELPACIDTEEFFEYETAKKAFKALLDFETLQEACSNVDEKSASLLRAIFVSDPPKGEISADVARLIVGVAERKLRELERQITSLLDGENLGESKDSDVLDINQKLEMLKRETDLVRLHNMKLDQGEHSALELLNWLVESDLFV